MKKLLALSLLIIVSCGGVVSNTPDETTQEHPRVIRLAAVGDISCGTNQRLSGKYDCADTDVANIIRKASVDYALLLGDIQYPTHSAKHFDYNFRLIWSDIMSMSFPIPGNHEYSQGGAKGYYQAWGAEFPEPGYYSRLLDNDWVLISLNTNDNCTDVRCDKYSNQYRWLNTELTKYKNQCVIAMMHHPAYSSGYHGNSKPAQGLYGLLAVNKVTMVLSGHDHHYERLQPRLKVGYGPPQFVVGTGGKDLRKVFRKDDASVKIIDTEHGVLIIEIQEKTAKTYFLDIDGNILDSSTIACEK